MEQGETRVVEIQARPRWNETGIVMRLGEVYALSAAGTWWDASQQSGPEGYPVGGGLLGLLQGLRRRPSDKLFALIGEVEGSRASAFCIGTGCTWRVAAGGRLRCYANDVDGFYWNNRGSVMLTVRRLG